MSAHGQMVGTPSSSVIDHHESPEPDLATTLISTGAIIVTVILACIASWVVYQAVVRPANERDPTPLYGEGLTLPAEPRLEGIETMSAARNETASDAAANQLQTYGWVDREKRVVRIPIRQAMELAVEQSWLPSSAGGNETKDVPANKANEGGDSR
jgi:hypothetical protein